MERFYLLLSYRLTLSLIAFAASSLCAGVTAQADQPAAAAEARPASHKEERSPFPVDPIDPSWFPHFDETQPAPEIRFATPFPPSEQYGIQITRPDITALILANPLLAGGFRQQDSLVIGFIKIVDGEVVQNIALAIPLSATEAIAASGDSTLSVKNFSASQQEGSNDLQVKIDVAHMSLVTLQLLNATPLAGNVTRVQATNEYRTVPLISRNRTQLSLERNQVTQISGMTANGTANENDGNTTRSKAESLFWCLW